MFVLLYVIVQIGQTWYAENNIGIRWLGIFRYCHLSWVPIKIYALFQTWVFQLVRDLRSDLLCLSAATVRKCLPEQCNPHDSIALKVHWSLVWGQYWKNDKCLSNCLYMPVAYKRAGIAYFIFKWSNSSAPNGYFWLVLGASWSRIWNKWFPTKKWIEKHSDCEGSLNNIWENAHWLASFTWNREYVFFFLWQKVWLQFLYWEVVYYLIQILKFNTELINHEMLVGRDCWPSSTPTSCLKHI